MNYPSSSTSKDKMNAILKSLEPFSDKMLNEFNLPPYHLVELFIYFDNFIENNLTISKESFITANSSLIQNDSLTERDIEEFSIDIFKIISSNTSNANLYILCLYLKSISINDKEINVDILSQILDKTGKGYIVYSDIEILVSGLEEFTNEYKDWSVYEECFGGKKITKRNLSQNDLDTEIFDLFSKAENVIQQKIERSYAEIPNSKREIANNNNNNLQCFASNNNVNINGVNLERPNSIYFGTNFTYNNGTNIYDMVFDYNKANIVHNIKMTSFLYDITLKELTKGFNMYKSDTTLDKNKFTHIINEIIQANTSNVFKFPYKKLSLSVLFKLIDVEHKNYLTFMQALGGVFTLVKSTSEEKISFILSFPKKKINELLTGMFSLYLNTQIINDLSFISDCFLNLLHDMNLTNSSEILNYIFNPNNSNNNNHFGNGTDRNDQSFDGDFSNESIITAGGANLAHVLSSLNEAYIQMKNNFLYLQIQSMSIIEITHKLIKHSLLGEINNFQLSSLLNSVIDEICLDADDKTKKKAKNEFMEVTEKYFDFSQNELIDVTKLHAFFILVFSGSTIEKMESIFLVNDVNENECLDVSDLIDYFTDVFTFLTMEMKVDSDIEWKELSKEICELIAKGRKKISLIMMVQFYESLINEQKENSII